MKTNTTIDSGVTKSFVRLGKRRVINARALEVPLLTTPCTRLSAPWLKKLSGTRTTPSTVACCTPALIWNVVKRKSTSLVKQTIRLVMVAFIVYYVQMPTGTFEVMSLANSSECMTS